MGKKCKYVRVITTVKGSFRNRGLGYNFRNMEETAEFFERLTNKNVSSIKQIRIVPTNVTFTKPEKVANAVTTGEDDYRW